MGTFDYNLDYRHLNLRKDFELYRVGKGEQGVLLVEPYKSEILPYWRFKTPNDAQKSVRDLLRLFHQYLKDEDFIGMDMTRKYLQMGYTRSRRYANHATGKKYQGPVPSDKRGQSGSHGRPLLPPDPDEEKAQSALIFWQAWQSVEAHPTYQRLKQDWKIWFG